MLISSIHFTPWLNFPRIVFVNFYNDVTYFDFTKSFDSINNDIILHKLKYDFHIDGVLLRFLVTYLKDRNQSVVIGGSKATNDTSNI